jgi:hypothetical protein
VNVGQKGAKNEKKHDEEKDAGGPVKQKEMAALPGKEKRTQFVFS